MAQIYYDADADLKALEGKTVAVIGYGSQGRGQSLCLRDSGIHVIIGARPGKSFDLAKADGMEVMDTEEAAKRGDVIQILAQDHLLVAVEGVEEGVGTLGHGGVLSVSLGRIGGGEPAAGLHGWRRGVSAVTTLASAKALGHSGLCPRFRKFLAYRFRDR